MQLTCRSRHRRPHLLCGVGQDFMLAGHVGGLVGTSTFSNPYGSSVFGGTVTTPGFLSGLQIGYNWTVAPRWVFGLQADGDYLASNGTSTCMQASGSIVGSNCRERPRALATLTGRLGFVPDPEGRTLVYGKGGAAWSRTDISVNPNNANLAAEGQDGRTFSLSGDPVIQGDPTSRSANAWGWTVGAGVERALTPAWSASLEYDYYRFNGISVATPEPSTPHWPEWSPLSRSTTRRSRRTSTFSRSG